MTDQGLILVYTGNGKGKTTAALGLGLRAVGHGLRVHMIQFMKGQGETGELFATQKLTNFTIEQAGRSNFVSNTAPDPMDVDAAEAGLLRAKQIINEQLCDILILDEINVAMQYDLLNIDEVKALINAKSPEMTIVLTGRGFPEELNEVVDMISEVCERKHHFQKGIYAKKGIEY